MDRRNSPAGGKVAAGRKATAKGKASNSLLVLSNDRLTKLPEELFRMVVENLHYGDKKRLKLACKSLRWKVGTIGRPTDVEGLLWRIYVMKHHEDYRYRDRPHRKRALADVSPGSCNDELKAIDKTLLHYYQNVEKDLNKLGHSPGLSWTFPADVKKIYSGRRRTRREDTPDTTDPDNDELGQHLTEPLMHTYGSTKPGRPYSTLAYHMIDAMRQHCEDATHSDYKWLHFPSTIPKQRLNIWGRMLARLEGRLARMVEYEVHVHKADQLRRIGFAAADKALAKKLRQLDKSLLEYGISWDHVHQLKLEVRKVERIKLKKEKKHKPAHQSATAVEEDK